MFSTYLQLWQEGNGIPYYTMATPVLSKAKSASGRLCTASQAIELHGLENLQSVLWRETLCETVYVHVSFIKGLYNNLLLCFHFRRNFDLSI